jgi:hypothetical protein
MCDNFKNMPEKTEVIKTYNAHMIEKDLTYKHYKHSQEMAKENENVLCASFDLQKVLSTPHSSSVLFFYNRKFQVFMQIHGV